MNKLILFLSVLIIASCNTAKHNTKRAAVHIKKALQKDRYLVAQVTRDSFPCTELFRTDTTTITNDSVVYIECPDVYNTPEIKNDTFNKVNNKSKAISVSIETEKPKPRSVLVPVKIPVSKFYVNKYWEDSSKIVLAYKEVYKKDQQIKSLEKKIVVKNTIIKCMAAAMFILLFLAFYKRR